MPLFRRARKEQSLRYYLYVSDSKLDMLYEQIPMEARRALAVKLKVDLKILSVELSKGLSSNEARMAKLAVVERFLERDSPVGGVADQGRYFRYRGPMQWAWLGVEDPGAEPSMVVFLNREDRHTVFLAGSRKHVLGERQPEGYASAYSATPNIIAAIGEHISQDPELGEQIRRWRGQPESSEMSMAASDPPEDSLAAVEVLRLDSPVQIVDSLAVRLLDGTVEKRSESGEERHVVIGTPLYVALADA